MTTTYSIRHGSNLKIPQKLIQSLWDNNQIAIHGPGALGVLDQIYEPESLDPDYYQGSARSTMKAMRTLTKHGGYVFATYRKIPGGKAGYIPPGSDIEILPVTYNDPGSSEHRVAMLKVAKMSKCKNLNVVQSISLLSMQPMQGTLCQWHKAGDHVESTLNDSYQFGASSLTPDQQKVMCMEFLRQDIVKKWHLPKLAQTVFPVGHSPNGIDILGISDQGDAIVAMVIDRPRNVALSYLDKLDEYSEITKNTLLFCDCKDPDLQRGHRIFPIRTVFDNFATSAHNQHWFRTVTGR